MMNPQETYSKVYRRKDTLNFSKADFGILQTQKVMNLKQDSRNDYRLESQLLNITPTITSFRWLNLIPMIEAWDNDDNNNNK